MEPDDFENRVLVLAPVGKDAECINSVIGRTGHPVKICRDLTELCGEIAAGAGCVLIVEEALRASNLKKFSACIQAQPPWSDLPVVILTTGGGTSECQLATLDSMLLIGNVTLLERPLRAVTLVTGVHGALRSRARQYTVRSLLQDQMKAREMETIARKEAERLNRVKDEFLSTLSHELRTPLTPLFGWTKMLIESRIDDVTRDRALRTIERNVKTQIQLIDDLLDISRIINGKMRLNIDLVDANKILEAAVDVVRTAALAKGVNLEMSPSRVPLNVLGDFDRLQQVFWNLLTNAVKFTPSGGTVRAGLRQQGTTMKCVVSDTGIGIKKEFLPRLFERFSQAESSITRSYGGLGIGLSLVYSLLELHGGSVVAESAGEGMGSTFTVSLPVQRNYFPPVEWKSPPAVERAQPKPRRLDGLKILLVEDHAETRDLLSAILTQAGSLVTSAGSVQDGFDLYYVTHPHIVISDLGLPGEDGFELIRKIRALEISNGRPTPAVALTAYATDADRSRCLAAGFQLHLVKPIEPARLVSALAEIALEP